MESCQTGRGRQELFGCFQEINIKSSITFDLDKAKKNRIVLIGGDEYALRHEAIQSMLSVVNPDDSFDFEELEALDSGPTHWVALASTTPFLSDRRTVLVRHLLRREPEGQEPSLMNAAEHARIILIADEEPAAQEDRKRKLDSLLKKWADIVTKAGGYVYLASLDAAGAQAALCQDAKQAGKKLNTVNAKVLLEMCGGNYSRARCELEKVLLFLGEESEIGSGALQKVVSPSREWSIWVLIDSISQGQHGRALTELRTLVGAGKSADEAAMVTIIPMLRRHLTHLIQARIILDEGDQLGQGRALKPSTAAILPHKGGLPQEKPFSIEKAMAAARRVTYDQCLAALEVLAHADAQLKGAEPGYNAQETLEALVLKLGLFLSPPPKIAS